MLFECHITYPRDKSDIIENLAKKLHWKFSKIDGDPVLGKEVFCYLTTHDKDFCNIQTRMIWAREAGLEYNISPVREKIECILYDTKVKV